ncbi:MAG TPA: hypothetical protein VE710_02520 [Candidatus Bathyarchaeia archaeon]|nr:hypothetical protein [Candidatus Bathyarchaeia archaeon]
MEKKQAEQQENESQTPDTAAANPALPEVWRIFFEEVQKAIREHDRS